MNRNKKAIIAILIIIVGLIVILTRVMPKNKTGEMASDKTIKQVDRAQQIVEYQKNIKSIAANYQNIIDAVNASSTPTGSSSQISVLEGMKNKLTSITVPAEFKDLHMDLFLSVLNLENYFKSNQPSAKASSSSLWQSLQKNYDWITK